MSELLQTGNAKIPPLHPEHGGRFDGLVRWFSSSAWGRGLLGFGRFCLLIYRDLDRSRAPTAAAAVAFFFMLSMVPFLILIASVLGFFPVPDVFNQMLVLIAKVMPPDAMPMMRKLVIDFLSPDRASLFSIGILTYMWSASGGFASMIEALDVAYDVEKPRSWLRNRLQAILMTVTLGVLVSSGLVLLILGPHFGSWLVSVFDLPHGFGVAWPYMRNTVLIALLILATELMYYIGPRCHMLFRDTLPGAAIAVGITLLGTLLLSEYLKHMGNLNRAYGPMGAVVVILLWLYMASLAILAGAEINSELYKRRQRLHGIRVLKEVHNIRALRKQKGRTVV